MQGVRKHAAIIKMARALELFPAAKCFRVYFIRRRQAPGTLMFRHVRHWQWAGSASRVPDCRSRRTQAPAIGAG
jgi:hypothetical protein